MTSRPGPGIPESLHHRGTGALARGQVRRQPSKSNSIPPNVPVQDCIDPNLDPDRRPAEEAINKSRNPTSLKLKPAPLEALHTTATDTVRPPPRGRPQLFFSNVSSYGLDAPVQSPHSQPGNGPVNLPVPPRPGSTAPGDVSRQRRIIPGGTGVKSEVAVKPPATDAPAPALLFPGGKTADLFPWNGNNPEDTLSEAAVKAGFSNKPQIMNETNTARPSLWSNLKNKSGLSTLSSLFVAVLEKRQQCGRLTATNTFKPPPRLTLRDSTRETWLHDLANPAVGLRRLSRTIPHGITGKVLLDQCLNKNIPIPRAMWLAKCVGLNEMRSHKRKGQAGTITWMRGWTNSVEQFLDGTITTIGQPDWKPRITYALQLATQLYKEHLLEVEHFLDWLLKSLETSAPERLFLWLLLSSIYWTDLTSSRRRGRRLAEALVNHAEKLYRIEAETPVSPILEFLENTIMKLIITRPACLLLPRSWDKHSHVLETLSSRRAIPQVSRAIMDLDSRNKRLLRPSANTTASSRDSIGKVYQLLDSIDYGTSVRIGDIASDCMGLMSDTCSLISTVLRWASTLYREGSHRIYLVTRLLRKWSHFGVDVYDGILAHLNSVDFSGNSDPRAVFRVIAELVRSKTFSAGRYLQWLIATGSLGREQDLSLSSAWPLRLITEIPLSGLSEQIRNLRGTLLRGTIYSPEEEEKKLDFAEVIIQQQAPGLFGAGMAIDSHSDLDINSLSSTVKLELGVWLRYQVAATVEIMDRVPTKDPSIEESNAVCRISFHDFSVVRSYLEKFEDLSILADVIGIAASSLDSQVLASAADTLHYNYRAFRAIGAFEPLFEKIAMRYAAIRTVRFPERDLLVSLSDLASTARADGQLMQLLSYDMCRFDHKNSVAACSPVSDNMTDATQHPAVDSGDEIERILSSGTSMDQQIMSRVFNKMVRHLEEQLRKGQWELENHPIWFYRLRGFDEGMFDGVLTEWLTISLLNHKVDLLSAALPPLVASGSMTLSHFLDITKDCMKRTKTSHPAESVRIAIDGLNILIFPHKSQSPSPPQNSYRYRLEQFKLCRDSESNILEAIGELIQLSSNLSSIQQQQQVSALLSGSQLLAVLRQCAVRHVQVLATCIGVGQHSANESSKSCVKSVLDDLLDPRGFLDLNSKSPEQQVSSIVEAANELSLPFCQLEIQHIFSVESTTSENTADAISSALLHAVKTAVERDQPTWADLLSGLESSLMVKIREHAEREILSASAFLNSHSDSGLSNRDDRAFLQKYLTVIDFTSTDLPKDGQVSVIVPLIERLKGIAEALAKQGDSSKYNTHVQGCLAVPQLCAWLKAFLHLAGTQGTMVLSKVANQQQAALLWSLRCLFVQPVLEAFPSVAQHVFDVATLLSDNISDEVRNHLMRLDAVKSADDTRCAFIFGTAPPPDGWLTLTKPAHAAPPLQPTSTGTPHPQQSNTGHSPYQGNSNPPMQRSTSQQQSQSQSQAQIRGYSQYPQQNKMPQQLQRMPSNGAPSQLQQLQQMQQMQALAQQRNQQSSPAQMQRQPQTPMQANLPAKPGASKQEKPDMRPTPFALRRWEILPDSGGNPLGNETAISLSLFGARKV